MRDIKERPIIFSGDEVRAILDGSKTQTRTPIKPQPHPEPARIRCYNWPGGIEEWLPESKSGKIGIFTPSTYKCPYGKSGDRLWVKETWAEPYYRTNDIYSERLLYRVADDSIPIRPVKWEPSRYMPRWASRITLEITSIRVERVQEISEEDARAEGVGPLRCGNGLPASDGFADLWNSIYGQWKGVYKKGVLVRYECYPWAKDDIPPIPAKARKQNIPCKAYPNSFVWVIEFKR